MRGRGVGWWVGGVGSAFFWVRSDVNFLIFKFKISKFQKVLPKAPLFSIFTFSDLRFFIISNLSPPFV